MTRTQPGGSRRAGRRSRFPFIALVVALSSRSPALAQTAATPLGNHVAALQTAAVRAVTFTQGDLASLMGAEPSFTPEGWSAFMRGLAGFVDAQGTPQFSSTFIPVGPPSVLTRDNGALHLSIPGTLTHRQNQSTTTYRTAALDVDARGTPLRIDRLVTKTCVGLPPGAVCR